MAEIKLKITNYTFNWLTKLIGNKCTNSLIVTKNFKDIQCLTLLFSKLLSIGIIFGSSIVKLPQILKILLSQSVEGISFLSFLLETISASITFAYNFRLGNQFTTYGETLFITLQNLIVVLLIGYYGGKMMQLIVLMALYSVFMSSLLVPDYVGSQTMSYLQALTIPLAAFSRIPQIIKIWTNKQTGQLSSLTALLLCFGSIARVFTTFREVTDKLLLSGFILSAVLNTIILLQILIYSKSTSSKVNIRKSKKNN
jgi:mannose-P-dolichol utilization defect protein 1